MKSRNTFRVYFTKTFTSGILKGLTHSDKVDFACWGSAENWINTIKFNIEKEIGNLNFILDHARIEAVSE